MNNVMLNIRMNAKYRRCNCSLDQSMLKKMLKMYDKMKDKLNYQ
ncbi:MAG: hypothetical protein QW128_08020 [Thermoprotei archaeon]